MTTLTDTPTPAGPSLIDRLAALWRRHGWLLAALLAATLLTINLVAQPNISWPYMLATFAPLAICAMATTPAIIAGRGGLDVSISPMMTFLTIVFCGGLIPIGLGGWIAFPIILVVGAALGALNGAITVWLRLPAIVVTLSMYFIYYGLSMALAPSPLSAGRRSWVGTFAGEFGPFPAALVLILLPVVAWFLLMRTLRGRQLLAVGANDATALASGVPVAGIRIMAFALGGFMAGIGAIALLALVRIADASQATAYTLISIAAVALGGTSLAGGRGGVIGPLLGAACIFLMQSLLTILQINQAWLGIFYGGLLLLAVVLGAALTSRGAAQ